MKCPIVKNHRLSIVAALSLVLASALGASEPTINIVPPDGIYHGKTYAEWSADATQLSLEHPLEGHPALNTPDFDPRSGQRGAVWFLGGPLETAERSIKVPAGKALFLILINVECSSVEPVESGFHGDTEAEQRTLAKFWADHIVNVACVIDGAAVANIGDFRFSSPQFSFEAPTPWLFGDVGGTGTSVADGYSLLLEPLPKGEHTIHFTGVFRFTVEQDGFDGEIAVDMTYHINAD
jgi:hypothetical protein